MFSEYNEKTIERQINDFLKAQNLSRSELIDIKLSTSSTNNSDHGELFTALIIYEN
uniref:sporulation protein Cse60 n=1 Tax=Paenibacillus sp. FSL P2-0121 TaxID=2921626 RepID=UPI00403EFCBF